ncbi:type II toxin-antitoxin system RelE/ParE family toxin [candidate division KSB1 bacterium]|nr:type II toxin-antitoxin system RelE/ParE family toxin [candidate division KSB1 bacterium]
MEVCFRTKKLQRHYENGREAERAYGRDVARKYIQRINIIKQVCDINELCVLPGLSCHPLKGDRRGQWAVKLTGFYRLIFSLKGKKLEVACIEEVSKHYDD